MVDRLHRVNDGFTALQQIDPVQKHLIYGYLRQQQKMLFPNGNAYFNLIDSVGVVVVLISSRFLLPRRVTYTFKNEKFSLLDCYVPIKYLGKGTYSIVIEAKDTRFSRRKVVIKKIKDMLYDIRDAKRVLEEITLLHAFKHDDIIQLYDAIPPDEFEKTTFNDICLVMPRMKTTLKRIIKSNQKLENRHHLFYIYQILRGLKYIHSAGFVHRDIKPENILVNAKNGNIKISNFGLARRLNDIDNIDKHHVAVNVIIRWYRAPEMMLCSHYNQKVDLWAVGCIFGELMLRRELFPGNNFIEQLSLIFSILSTPFKHELDWIIEADTKEWVNQLKPLPGHDLRKIFKNGEPEAIDLIRQLLKINPYQRISAAEALSHPYFVKLHHPQSEKTINIGQFTKSIEKNFIGNSLFGVRHLMHQTLTKIHIDSMK